MDYPGSFGIERRQQQRKPLRANAELLLPGAAPVTVRTLDISIGGIGVVSALNLPSGSQCVIRLASPAQSRGAPTIRIDATITHSIFTIRQDGFMIGLRFGDLSPEAVEAVTKYLNG